MLTPLCLMPRCYRPAVLDGSNIWCRRHWAKHHDRAHVFGPRAVRFMTNADYHGWHFDPAWWTR
jgi:hypothetical protein